MKNGVVWIGIVGLALVGVALTQGVMGFSGQPGGYGQGMMQGYRYGSGGMGMMSVYPAQAQPVTPAAVKARLEAFAQRFGPDARLKDLMRFSQNTYAQVVDSRGNGLAEVVADRYTGSVRPEPGPNMMWNGQYGMGYGVTASRGTLRGQANPVAVRYSQAAAQKLAESFLGGYLPGARVIEGQAFAGYYTFDYGRSAAEGMLSVNAYSGEVWVHPWHGTYLGEQREG